MLLASLPALAVNVADVRLWRAPDHTRVVLDLSGPVEHRLISLENPSRLVVDIEDATLTAALSLLPLSDTPVRQIRSGVRDGDDLRLVLDLKASIKPRSFLLKANESKGDRLVLDLYDKQVSNEKPRVSKSVDDAGKKRQIIVAIDAGHGGEDPGALGPKKRVQEKKVVLAIAKELEKKLDAARGYRAELIRTGDYYVGLKKRRSLARDLQADLFVSIHADAFKSPKARGSSVYILSQRGASSTFASFLAQRENAADLVGGTSLTDKDDLLAEVLYDMSLDSSRVMSRDAGARVLERMGGISRLHSKSVEQAAFAVLKSPDIPSILVETGFISNPEEARLLSSKSYQKKMAGALFEGITNYFATTTPPGTLLAWDKRDQGTTEYVISRGDTLSHISRRFNVTIAAIRQRNDLRGNTIRIGQKLIIPTT